MIEQRYTASEGSRSKRRDGADRETSAQHAPSAILSSASRSRSSARWLLRIVALVVVAVAAFGQHIRDGGFLSDDWGNAADVQFAEPPRILSYVDQQSAYFGTRRPLLRLLLPVPHVLFPEDQMAHIALGIALALVMALAFLLVLERLGLPLRHAVPCAALALVFPASDSTRLWPTATVNTVSVTFVLVGYLLTYRGLAGSRRPYLLHMTGAAFVLAGLLVYEAIAGVVLILGLSYYLVGDPRTATRRLAVDVALVLLVALLVYTSGAGARVVPPWSARIADVPRFAAETPQMVAQTLVPAGVSSWWSLVVPAIWLIALRGGGRRASGEIRAISAAVAGSAVVLAFALLPALGSSLSPMDPGLNNRANLAAALPASALVYAVLALTVMLAVKDSRRRSVVLVAAAALVIVSAAWRIRSNAEDYARAADLQGRALVGVRAALERPPSGATLFTFGVPGYSAPAVPVFAEEWDLDGAVRLLYRDATLNAYPVVAGMRLTCDPSGVMASQSGPTYGDGISTNRPAEHGRTYFVEPATRRAVRVDDAGVCQRALRDLEAGPLLSPR